MSKRIPRATLDKLQALHDHVAANPYCTQADMAAHLQCSTQTIRRLVGQLRDTGHLSKYDHRGTIPATYCVTALPRPVSTPARRKPSQSPAALVLSDTMIKRRVVPATQIGMRRDSLVAAFFGAGPAVHA